MMNVPSSAASASCMKRDCEETEVPREMEAVFISCPFTLHPRACQFCRRRQVSWLTDQRPSPPSRRRIFSGIWRGLPHTVAGAATALGKNSPAPHSLLAPKRNRRLHDYRENRDTRQTKF